MNLRRKRRMIRELGKRVRDLGFPSDLMLTDIQYRRKVQAVRLGTYK